MKWIAQARMSANTIPDVRTGKIFLDYDKLLGELHTFQASIQTEVSREFYSILDKPDLPCL